jgi:hypothetical protein
METRSDQFEFAKSHFFDTSGWSSFCAITLTLKQARRSEGALKSFSSRGAQAAGWRKPSGRLFLGKLRPPTQSNYVLEHIVRPPSLLNVPARNRSVPELLWKTCKGCDATIIAAEAVDVRGLDMKFVSLFALLLATSPVAAQTPGTPSSQICTEDPTYCEDAGAATQSTTTTGSGTSSSASSGGSGGGSSSGGSSGGGAASTPAIPNSPCGDGMPMDAWGTCN